MATNAFILIILISVIAIAAEARVQLINCFDPQNSSINRHGTTLTETGDRISIDGVQNSTQENTAAYSPLPADSGEEEINTTPISSVKEQYVLKAVVVMLALAFISSVATVLIRRFGSGRRRAGRESHTREESELRTVRVRRVDQEMPTYEPRPLRGANFNFEFNIIKFNNNLSPWAPPP